MGVGAMGCCLDHLGLRMRSCPREMNQPRSCLFLLMDRAAAVSYHLAPPCLPDLISVPVQQVHQQTDITVMPLYLTHTLPSL